MSDGTTLRKNSFFGSIYFVEGMVLTMFSSYMVIYLRKFNLSFTQIGVVSAIALLPTILKIFIGIVSDKWSLFGRGHRKPYIVAGLVLQGLGYAVYPLISPVESYGLFVFVSLCIGLGMATYDTTTDGLAIDITPASDRGIVQGWCVGGRASSAVAAGFSPPRETGTTPSGASRSSASSSSWPSRSCRRGPAASGPSSRPRPSRRW